MSADSGPRKVELPYQDEARFVEAEQLIAEAAAKLAFSIGDIETQLSRRLVELSPDSIRAIAKRGWLRRGDGEEQANAFLVRVLARIVRTRPTAERASALFMLRRIPMLFDDNTSGWTDLQRACSVALADADEFLATLPEHEVNVEAVEPKVAREITPERTAKLIAQLKSSDQKAQEAAARELGEARSAEAIRPLFEKALAGTSGSSIDVNCTYALAQIGEPAVPMLLEVLEKDEERARLLAAEVLGRIGSRAAVPLLVSALGEKSLELRACAAEALGRIGDKVAVKPLIAAFDELAEPDGVYFAAVDAKVRRSAVEALGRLADPKAKATLKRALKDRDSSVRSKATEALEKVKAGPASPRPEIAGQLEEIAKHTNAAFTGGCFSALVMGMAAGYLLHEALAWSWPWAIGAGVLVWLTGTMVGSQIGVSRTKSQLQRLADSRGAPVADLYEVAQDHIEMQATREMLLNRIDPERFSREKREHSKR